MSKDVNIYCDTCLKKGIKKLLGKNINAKGVIRLWCKECREEKTIELK